jgi:Domain of unknown function (DUF4351)
MSQFPDDKFAKELFNLLLTPLGNVNLQRTIGSETKFVDVYFEPQQPPAQIPDNGLLSQCLNQYPAIFEVFRSPVTVGEIQTCVVKVLEVQQEFIRESKRLKQPSIAQIIPRMWILTPTLATHTLNGFGAVNDEALWGKGVYLLPVHFQAGIIVVHQLPKIPETVWFRLMGKGKVQQEAMLEVAALPESHPLQSNALDLFLSLKLELEAKPSIEPEERELIMQLSPLLLEKIAIAKQEGRQEGHQEGRQEGETIGEARMVVRLLNRRFGEVPNQLVVRIQQLTISQLEELGEALLDFDTIGELETWLDR